MTIKRSEFESFVRVQRSGITNMWDVKVVGLHSGLSKEQIIDIITNYDTYTKKFSHNKHD